MSEFEKRWIAAFSQNYFLSFQRWGDVHNEMTNPPYTLPRLQHAVFKALFATRNTHLLRVPCRREIPIEKMPDTALPTLRFLSSILLL